MFTHFPTRMWTVTHTHTDVVPLKGGTFPSAPITTDILQHDLLCSGSEDNLLNCSLFTSGRRDCPLDHTEDAAVICDGQFGRYSGTALIWTLMGRKKVSVLVRCPHFRG